MSENNFLNTVEEFNNPSNTNGVDTSAPDNSIINSEEGINSDISSNTWWPSLYINPDTSGGQQVQRSSLINSERVPTIPLATEKRFGLVTAGDGLRIFKSGVISLNVGNGFKIDEETKKIVFDSGAVFTAGMNISIEQTSNVVISVIGDSYLNPNTTRVPNSNAVNNYVVNKTGIISNLPADIFEPTDKRDITTAITRINEKRTHTHRQITPETEWVITHKLNKKPSVTIVTEDNDVVVGDISYPSAQEVIVRFTSGFSGSAFLN